MKNGGVYACVIVCETKTGEETVTVSGCVTCYVDSMSTFVIKRERQK